MSEEMFKAGIRWKIEQLKDASTNEVVEFFRILGLEPDDVEDDYIDYPEEAGKLHPRKEDGDWYLEFIMILGYAYDDAPFVISWESIHKVTEKIEWKLVNAGLYPAPYFLDPGVFAYSWYNGGDEPWEPCGEIDLEGI